MSTRLLILANATSLAVRRLSEEAVVGDEAPPEGTTRYIVDTGDGVSIAELPSSLLVAAYNATRTKPIKGFHDRTTAVAKGLGALQVLAAKNGEPVTVASAPVPEPATTQEGDTMAATATKTKKRAKGAKKGTKQAATKGATRYRLINMEPTAKSKDDVKPARAGSKTAVMIDLLAEGATLPQLEKALSEKGKPVNARAWVTGFGRFGYGVKAVNDKAELPVYKLVYPAGMRQPLAHKTAKSADEE